MKITIEHHQISEADGAFNITIGAGGPWETKRSFCYEPDGFSFDEAKSEAQAFHDGACSMFETIKSQMILDTPLSALRHAKPTRTK